MSQSKGTSLSLRPFPISDTKPKSLADFITRINSQPGGFRDVDEDKLRQERLAQQHALDGEDVDMSDVEEDVEEGDGTGTQDLMQSRMEVLQNIEYVRNTRLEEF
jgi:mediator of RNA polymerase II transcription subunit 17, fungi type